MKAKTVTSLLILVNLASYAQGNVTSEKSSTNTSEKSPQTKAKPKSTASLKNAKKVFEDFAKNITTQQNEILSKGIASKMDELEEKHPEFQGNRAKMSKETFTELTNAMAEFVHPAYVEAAKLPGKDGKIRSMISKEEFIQLMLESWEDQKRKSPSKATP